MVFTTHIFVFYFLPFALLVYYNLPYRWRNPFLTLISYGFYGWWNPWFTTLMLACTAANFAGGRILGALGGATAGSSSRALPGRTVGQADRGTSVFLRRLVLIATIAASLGLLGFFKYFMFSVESLNSLLALFGRDALPILQVTLPIGISFFTFHAISYTVDVYRGEVQPSRSFLDFACFVALFPQLVAGPILRYHTVADQFVCRDHTVPRFAAGVTLFILGFAKKILLANPMGEVADAAFGAAAPAALDAWFGAAAYAFQIYFDFAAYSDMAVGLGRMLGFEFPKNFNAPYRAESITDLWRRWHISLSTFLRDYLYIPLGGNRKGPGRTYANLAVVMLLGGLWHGAKWTFIAWGAYHGLLLALERWRGKRSLYGALPRPLRIAATFLLMLVSWVLFRSESLAAAGRYLAAMVGLGQAHGGGLLLAAMIYTPKGILAMALCAALVVQPVQAFDWSAKPPAWPRNALLLLLFAFSLCVMATQAFNPFLYYQF